MGKGSGSGHRSTVNTADLSYVPRIKQKKKKKKSPTSDPACRQGLAERRRLNTSLPCLLLCKRPSLLCPAVYSSLPAPWHWGPRKAQGRFLFFLPGAQILPVISRGSFPDGSGSHFESQCDRSEGQEGSGKNSGARAPRRRSSLHLCKAVLGESTSAEVPRGFLGTSQTHMDAKYLQTQTCQTWDKGTGREASLRSPPADKIPGSPRGWLKNSLRNAYQRP